LDRHHAWIVRIQAEIHELPNARTKLVEAMAEGREGRLVAQQAGRGALLRREHSPVFVTWLQLDHRVIAYHERAWQKERRWQCPRTPEAIRRIDALVGKAARLQAECKAAGRHWYDTVKEAVSGPDAARSAPVRS
jgi:hypothetical protein